MYTYLAAKFVVNPELYNKDLMKPGKNKIKKRVKKQRGKHKPEADSAVKKTVEKNGETGGLDGNKSGGHEGGDSCSAGFLDAQLRLREGLKKA